MTDDCREAFEKKFKTLDFTKTRDAWDREIYAHSHIQAMFDGWQACWNARTPPAGDAQSLYDMVVVQETPEQKAAFMVNWLRGTIKIPDDVQERIYQNKVAASKGDAQGVLDMMIDDAIGALKAIREEVGNGLKLSVRSQNLGYQALDQLTAFKQHGIAALSAPKPAGDAQGDYKPRHTGAIDEMDDSVLDRISALSAPKIDFEGLKREVTELPNPYPVTSPYHGTLYDDRCNVIDHIAAKYPQLRGE